MLDPHGNVLCIGVSGTAREKVYFWYHEEEISQEERGGSLQDAKNVYFVAASFEEFVSKLCCEPAA